ncbi:MAG: ABC transporter substrate-binding protein [Acidobacteriota bacterium]|nr:ABC transporter substrate-binding protein [Acidobacteriota bacterium]
MSAVSSGNCQPPKFNRRSLLSQLGLLGLGAGSCSLQSPAEENESSSDLKLTMALVGDYDRTGMLLDGSVKPEGIHAELVRVGPTELFRRMAQETPYDISEMSTSTYMILTSRGDNRYVGLPVFPSRNFRHGYIYVNQRSGIKRPEDLSGKRVGALEYQATAALWQRTFLLDDFGIRAQEIEWFEGGLNEPNAPERFHVELPSDIHINRIGEGETLSNLLEKGSMDALIGPAEPECFRTADHIVRLFPDYRAVERDYYQRTQFFPIMHMVVIRNSLYKSDPWIAESIYQAFEKAKVEAFERLWQTGVLACAIPWLMSDLEEIESVFGPNHWPYGIDNNRELLERMTQASYEQGLSTRKLELEELFVKEMWKT